MKNLKIVALCLVIVQILFNNFWSFDYFRQLFASTFDKGISGSNISSFIQTFLWWVADLFILILAIVTLAQTDKTAQNKTYAMFRLVYIMNSIFIIPYTIYAFFAYTNFFFEKPLQGSLYLFKDLIWFTAVIILFMCKPEKPVPKINLQEYELVAYTTTWHRFVHNIMDLLLLLPVWLFWLQILEGMVYNDLILRLVFILIYLLYCFLSETIFTQTFGKMITRSCVTGNGVELTTGRVLIRSLCRLIPFNAISFLVGGKWHDKVSHTAVVYVDTWEKAFEGATEERPQLG